CDLYSSTLRRVLYRSPPATVCPRRWHDLYSLRLGSPGLCQQFCLGSRGSCIGRHRLVGFSSRGVPGRSCEFGWPAWICAITLSSRRQCWQLFGSIAGGTDRL